MGKKKSNNLLKKKDPNSQNNNNAEHFSDDNEEELFQDFSSCVSPFIFSNKNISNSPVALPALSVMPPQVLFYSPEECLRQCRGGRKIDEYEKTLHRKVNLLMMTLFARSSFLSTRWAPFLPDNIFGIGGNGKRKELFDFNLNNSHNHHSNCPCNGNVAQIGFGARLYSHMLQMKNRLMTNPQYIAEGDIVKPYDERLSGYWANLDPSTRISLVMEEIEQLKSLIVWDNNHPDHSSGGSKDKPTPSFRIWCTCSFCLNRKVGIKDLVEQIHRAFLEEMSRYVAGLTAKLPEEDEVYSRTKKSLYRNLAIVCQSILVARSRPPLDIINEFVGLKFNDYLPYKHKSTSNHNRNAHCNNKGKSTQGEEDFTDDDSDNVSCNCDGVFIEDLDPFGFEPPNINFDEAGEDDNPFLDTMDYSDDEGMLESMNGTEIPLDEGFFISPVVTSASLSKEQDEALISEGRELFKYFASELFHHRLVLGYLQKATLDRQNKLLLEEEESEKLSKEKELAKQEAKRRKKEKQKLQKTLKSNNNNINEYIIDEPDIKERSTIEFKEQELLELERQTSTQDMIQSKENLDKEPNVELNETLFIVEEIKEDLNKDSDKEDLKYSDKEDLKHSDKENLKHSDNTVDSLFKNGSIINEPMANNNALSVSDIEEELLMTRDHKDHNDKNDEILLDIDEDILFKRLEQELKLLQSFVDNDPIPPGFESKMCPPINESINKFLPSFWWDNK